MKIELDIPQNRLSVYKELFKGFQANHSFYVLTQVEHNDIEDLLSEIVQKIAQKEEQEKFNKLNGENRCKCFHTHSFHSQVPPHICCFIECKCWGYEANEN